LEYGSFVDWLELCDGVGSEQYLLITGGEKTKQAKRLNTYNVVECPILSFSVK
jgi:hypothetical protein